MSRLTPAKLHVTWRAPATETAPLVGRRYTLTHSDATGDLFLSVGLDYDGARLRALYTRFMRDEVLAEWLDGANGPELHVYCHVSGGIVFGGAAMRDAIFRRELPLVLEAFRYGERAFFAAHPHLDDAAIIVHFQSTQRAYNRIELWGTPADHRGSVHEL